MALINNRRGASLIGYGLVIGLISVVALTAITGTGSTVKDLFGNVAGEMASVAGPAGSPGASPSASPSASSSPVVRASCNAIAVAESPPTGHQLRVINPGGGEYTALCYFADSFWGGGGFTAILAQYEEDPIIWAEGRQPDYQPDLISSPGTSFALTGADIPSHSDIMFGRVASGVTGFVDIIPHSYSTGNIALASVTSAYTSTSYHIHRNSSSYYFNHDPEDGSGSLSRWNDTLTIDATGGIMRDWAFSPANTEPNKTFRGFNYNGNFHGDLTDSFAWVLYVR